MSIKRILLLVSSATLFFNSGAFALSFETCSSNTNSSCSAKAKFLGNVTTGGTYSADSNSVQYRFYMRVKDRYVNQNAGVGTGCFNDVDNTTLAVIAAPPGSAQSQKHQDWRNMVMVSMTTGMPLTIFTDGACNVYDMWLN